MTLVKREIKEEGKEKAFFIGAAKALRIALEDSETSFFMKAHFSTPEQKPQIVSHRWLSSHDSGYRWNIEIIEKNKSLSREEEMINIALLEVDPRSGEIIRRQFFHHIFLSEYRRAFDRRIK